MKITTFIDKDREEEIIVYLMDKIVMVSLFVLMKVYLFHHLLCYLQA